MRAGQDDQIDAIMRVAVALRDGEPIPEEDVSASEADPALFAAEARRNGYDLDVANRCWRPPGAAYPMRIMPQWR